MRFKGKIIPWKNKLAVKIKERIMIKFIKNILESIFGVNVTIKIGNTRKILSIKLLKTFEYFKIFTFSNPYRYAYQNGKIDKNYKDISNFIDFDNGIYFEIGALDGFFHSPSYSLSAQKNWKGMMVDGNKKLLHLVKLYRPKDEVVHAACSSKENSLKADNCSFLNLGHSGEIYLSYDQIDTYSKNLLEEFGDVIVGNEIPLTTVTDLINTSKIIKNCTLDLMVIDVEGHEMEVLSGYDFDKINTSYFLIESRTSEEQRIINSFLSTHNYKCVGQTSNTDFMYKKHEKKI